MSDYRPLLASYGGGHAEIVAVLADAMSRREISPEVIGFTTGHRYLLSRGIRAKSVEVLFDPREDGPFLEAVEPFIGNASHSDVSAAETRAYFALGFRDLVHRLGWDAARDEIRTKGRKAFEPVSVMARYLRRTRPDIVITTTSPRFEFALLKAARQEGIPALAIGDHFLINERAWILGDGYAENVAVLSKPVADLLIAGGFRRNGVRVTGNPAFDGLVPTAGDAERRRELREKMGMAEKTVILWPAAGGTTSMTGGAFLSPETVSAAFEELCREDPSFAYILRPHPNFPFDMPAGADTGFFDNGRLSARDALLVSDVVIAQASTMGLQAALRGTPVICVSYSEYMHYPRFGLAHDADTFDDALDLLRTRRFARPSDFAMPPLGSAADNVLEYIEEILGRHPGDEISGATIDRGAVGFS